jgi:ABC-type transport system involved in multi-copper enzyme maturation permease subunit
MEPEAFVRYGQPSALSLAGFEARSALRATAFRSAAVAAFLVGLAVGAQEGHGAGPSAWAAGEASWHIFGFIVVVWMSMAAVADQALRTDVLLYTKPQPTERIVAAKFMAILMQILLANAALFVGAACAHYASHGSLAGLWAYALRYWAASGALLFLGAAAYALALLTGTPLAGSGVGLFLALALAGRSFLAKAYIPAYTQNVPTYMALGLACIGIACWFYRTGRRGKTRVAWYAPALTILGLGLAIANLKVQLAHTHDPLSGEQPALDLMEAQNIVPDNPAPGFLLPDQYGRPTQLSAFAGRILVIALWSPADPDTVAVLDRLQQIARRYGAQGVQPIAICLSEDVGAVATFAQGEMLSYPMVEDWGTHHAPDIMDSSPLANAYQVTVLPKVVVTDRRRRIKAVLTGLDVTAGTMLEEAVKARLSADPQ